MSTHFLVVSNPPHGTVDAARAAKHFGLTAAEARMKTNFSAPEIWLTAPDRGQVERSQSSLADCGVRAAVLEGQDLLAVPEKMTAQAVVFDDGYLVVESEGGSVKLTRDAALLGVYCKPAAELFTTGRKAGTVASDLGRPSSSVMLDRMSRAGAGRGSESDASESAAFLDLYVSVDGAHRRYAFVAGVTDFSRLESVGRDPLHALVAECEGRFTGMQMDRRLENVRVRARPVVGQPTSHEEQRKLFSFGSLALAKLLGEISPDLKDLTQNELGSRLSFLMTK